MKTLKMLGLALAAVGAVGALGATAASASFLTSDGSVTLKITQIPTGLNAITAFGGEVLCNSTYTGHKYNETPKKPLESTETLVTVSPKYEACETILGESKFPTTIDTNSCDFVIHPGETTETNEIANTYGLVTTMECVNAEDKIQITLFSGAAHTLKVCTILLSLPEEGVEGPHIRNTGPVGETTTDFYDIKGSFLGANATKNGLCGSEEEKETAVIDVDWRVKGYNESEESTGVTISD